MANNVYDFIKEEEKNYKTQGVPIAEGYDFVMYEHLRMSTLFRDSKYTQGPNDFSRPFKNIIRRLRNMALVAMDFDVKDIEPFVNDAENFYKSFLVRKFHPQWARKNNIDTYIDDLIESYEDYGGALSKHINQIAPEIVPLQSLAFCDQTDILSGPICIKHQYSPSQLKEMAKKGWKNIDDVITYARAEKQNPNGVASKTPGKYIEAYELDGMFPRAWLLPEGQEPTEDDLNTYTQQLHIITYYKSDKNEDKGIALFQGVGDPDKYKFIARDPIFGRALGMGGIEELFQPQIWVNYDAIRIQGMLDAASKTIHITTDAGLATRNKITDVDNGEFLKVAENSTTTQLNTQPVNLPEFTKAAAEWELHAQGISSANDALLGQNPASGTPFKLQELVVQQGKGPHERRKGKIATHLSEIYRDWILPDLVKEMNNEQEFSEELSLDELQYVLDKVVMCETNAMVKEAMLSGQVVTEELVAKHKQMVTDQFMRGGSKRFFKLVQDELKDLPVDVEVNIAGKQKNLSLITDKLANIFRQIIAAPQVLNDPRAAKIFNMILETSGLSEIDFKAQGPVPAPVTPPGQPTPGGASAAGGPGSMPAQGAGVMTGAGVTG